MRLAIPLTGERLSQHFGHCEKFAIFEIDGEGKQVLNRNDETPPAHAPGVLPQWLAGIGVNVIIAGGMGQRAQQLFSQSGIEVIVGAPDEDVEKIVANYLAGQLQCGQNICDH